ncbi:hypothetical protein [Microbulbifer sp. JMSA008]|uniref:hypothetical protein n=1 Tax=Microbulbifer sp. JMSA008 TaxID=3243373 RepID=UPI00403942AE
MISMEDVSLADLERYLTSKGWLKVDALGTSFEIWVFPGLSMYEITLPVNEGHKRFRTLVDDALSQLCSKESLGYEELIRKIISPTFDRMLVRVVAGDVSKGRIPFNEGIDLYSSTFDLLKDSARCLHKFKDKQKHILAFKSEVMMGQTQVGSYIISLDSPLYEIGDSEVSGMFDQGKSLGRLINEKTFDKVRFISEFLDDCELNADESKFDEFELHELTSKGITNTVCDSLLKLFGVKSHRDLELTFEWSPKEDIDESYKKSVFLSSKSSTKIRTLGELLKNRRKEASVTLVGNIEDLHRRYKDEDGRAKLKTKYKNREVGITFDVAKEIYDEIVGAHSKKYAVQITGEVHSFLSSKKMIAKFNSIEDIQIKKNGDLDYVT